MPVPTMQPSLYAAPDSPGADDYHVGQPVWVHRAGVWRPGVVLRASHQAVMVRYRPAAGPGTGVDTVTCHSLTARTDPDPVLDRAR